VPPSFRQTVCCTKTVVIRGNLYFLCNFFIISGRNCFFSVLGNYIGVLQIKIKFSYHVLCYVLYQISLNSVQCIEGLYLQTQSHVCAPSIYAANT